MATNTGLHAAILKKTILLLHDANTTRRIVLVDHNKAEGKQLLIKPNEWKVISLIHMELGDEFSSIYPEDYKSCHLDFYTLNLNHETQKSSISIACSEVLGKE